MFARATAKDEEEFCEAKDENERQRQLADAAFKNPRADVSEKYLGPEQQEPESPDIKEEDKEPRHIKNEEAQPLKVKEEEPASLYIKEEEDFTEFPVTCVLLKSENEGQCEENSGAEPPSSSSCPHVKTEGDGDDCGGSRADSLLAPISDSDDVTSHSPDTDDDDDDDDNQSEDVSVQFLRPGQQEPDSPGIKEEAASERPHVKEEQTQPHDIKKEEKEPSYFKEEEDLTQFPVTGVPLKTEDEGGSEENRGAEPPSSSSSQRKTEGDRDNCGESQADSLLTPLSEPDDTMSRSEDDDDDDDDDEQTEGDMTRHIENKSWKCSRCGKTFVYESLWKKHMTVHTGEKPFACSVCSKMFSLKESLENHTTTHTGEKQFSCSVCGQRFSLQGNLKAHIRIHAGEQSCACSVCGRSVFTRGTLKRQSETHNGEEPFACSVCGQSTSTQRTLKSLSRPHTDVSEQYLRPEQQESDSPGIKEVAASERPRVKEEVQMQPRDIKKEAQEPSYFKEEADITQLPVTGVPLKTEDEGGCEENRGAEPPSSSSSQHTQTQDVSEQYLRPEQQEPDSPGIKEVAASERPRVKEDDDITQLPVTGVPLKTEDEGGCEENRGAEPPSSSSSQHTQTQGDGDHRGGSQADRLLTPLSDRDDTMSHSEDDDDEQTEGDMARHIENKSWKCSRCGKTFVYESLWKKHMMVHTGEKPFACSVCSKMFSLKESLDSHRTTHTGEKPFACSVCGQRFSLQGNLKAHTRIHENFCASSVSSQSTSTQGTLKSHVTHVEEKPFSCLVCGKRFPEKGYLKKHTRIHAGELPFACLVCDKRFSEKGTLKRHTRVHTGEKPFACSVCCKNSVQVHT
ncbi:gastrula zinc finger protein xFG20-1-like isoform X7 [Phycodurus eques]|uniref:gastrula zinc finger protein xFG20-1-like isoform X7 n=1 Tax=Phycodurus eques TaxID=693459 RepID=UPI002ACE5C97|nr:gastrula zinc finger protein xFG20-1-like isoform X7 [Phycodurus eques]